MGRDYYTPEQRAEFRRNVRWNYGPPIGDVTVIPAGDDLTPPA